MNFYKVERYLKLAHRVAYHSEYKIKVGAVLLVGGKVYSFGFNKDKTHPLFKDTEKTTTHAEIDALRASGLLKAPKSKMFIYRSNAAGFSALARPCEVCMQALKDFGVTDIYYTINDLELYYQHEVI